MINMTEKVPTRVNTQTPLTNFWTAKNVHGSTFSHATHGTVKFLTCNKFLNGQKRAWIHLFSCNPQNREVFELQTVLQSMENLHVPSKRVAQVKNSSGPVAFIMFILCGPRKEHTEKEVSRKNNEGKGNGVRAVGTPIMVLFNKSSFQILLVNPLNGLFWLLFLTVYYLMEMRSDSDDS